MPDDRASPPWGTHRPGTLFRVLLRLSRAVPQLPVLKQITFLLRRMARHLVGGLVDVEHQGLRLRLRTRGNISESTFLFMPRRWDRKERRFLAGLPADATFLDIGANAGGYTWYVLGLIGPAGRIIAVEPDPELRARLEFNLETNGETRVDVVGAAVGPRTGEGWIRINSRNRGQNTLAAASDGEGHRVPVLSLPDLLRKADVTRVDGLKIDVEGLEAAILDDFFDNAPRPLWPRLLLTEVRDAPEHHALLARLRRLGYESALRTHLNVGLRLTTQP